MAQLADFQLIDRGIASALQVGGRASWGAIARALDVPERTVARRGQRLLDTGAVRVSTYLDTTIVGHARPLVIEVNTTAGRAMAVGEQLCARPDASSVSVLEGSGELTCLLLPRTPEDSARLMLVELPSIEGVVSIRVGTVLRSFRSGYDWVAQQLPAAATAGLRAEDTLPAVERPAEVVELSDEDEALIAELAKNGRATVVALARTLELSTATVRRRVDWLFAVGALHVRTEVSPALHGLRVEALSWLSVRPDRIEQVGTALGRHPSVRFCVALTGASQLMIDVLVPDVQSLFAFLTADVGELGVDGIDRTSVVVAPLRRGPMMMAESEIDIALSG